MLHPAQFLKSEYMGTSSPNLEENNLILNNNKEEEARQRGSYLQS
jgi:hypothetical protein